jgi:ribonuclease HI
MQLIIHTDGGARGNPGPAGIGFTVEELNDNGNLKVIYKKGKVIGETTNNVAEYQAVKEALEYLKSNPEIILTIDQINFLLDSTLVVNQLNGLFKVKDSKLRVFITDIRILESEIGKEITYKYIPREQNRQADFLVNQALDRGV